MIVRRYRKKNGIRDERSITFTSMEKSVQSKAAAIEKGRIAAMNRAAPEGIYQYP